MTDKLPDFVESWIDDNAGDAADWMADVDVISVSTLRDFLAKFVLCKPEIAGWLFQHEETGNVMIIDDQQVEWGFERHNPRLQKIHALHAPATKAP